MGCELTSEVERLLGARPELFLGRLDRIVFNKNLPLAENLKDFLQRGEEGAEAGTCFAACFLGQYSEIARCRVWHDRKDRPERRYIGFRPHGLLNREN
jgi:hypothetical protein